jgi:hypothetical protein
MRNLALAENRRLVSVHVEVSLLRSIPRSRIHDSAVPDEGAAGLVSQSPWHLQNSNGYHGVTDLTGLQVLVASEYTDISELKIRENMRENVLAEIGLIAEKREAL